MDRLHRSVRGWAFKLLIVLLISSLLLGGLWGYFPLFFNSERQAVAVVNGEKIKFQQFNQIYQSITQRLREQWGESFSALTKDKDYIKRVKRQIVDQMISQQLYQNYVSQLGLQVSDAEITTAIEEIDFFQKAGKFDAQRYQSVLQKSSLTEEILRKQVKQQLLYQQLIGTLTHSEFVLPEENRSFYSLLQQQREVRTATVALKPLIAKQTVEATEVKKYYEQHAVDFLTPERVKVRYLSINAPVLLAGITIADQEVAAYYQKHPQRYSQSARQHIHLIRVPTAEQAADLLNQLTKGEIDFATLAKAHSNDTLTAPKGGEVGWIDAGNLPTALEQALATLQPGQLSPVVQLDDGFYLLRLNQKQAEQLRPLQQVRVEIMELLRQQKISEKFNRWQQQIQQLLDELPENLNAIEQLTEIKAQESDWFSRDQPPVDLNDEAVMQVLFDKQSSPEELMAEWIKLSEEQAVVVQVLQRQLPEQKPFEQVASEITEKQQYQKAQQAARQQAEALLLTLREKPNEKQQTMQQAGITWTKKQWLTRKSADHRLSEVVFSHPKPTVEQSTYGLTENADGDMVLFELLQVKTIDAPQEQKLFLASFLQQRTELLLHTLDVSLRQQAAITIRHLDNID